MSPLRRILLVGLACGAGLVLGACGEPDEDRDAVRDAILATRQEPYRFVYSEETPERAITVQGLVEDDFRYKARLLEDGQPVFDEVVDDDQIAVRFVQTDKLARFVDSGAAGSVDIDTSMEGITVRDALLARRWVLDPSGAPALTGASRTLSNLGQDPIFDAFTVFDYVERAMGEAFAVNRYSEDDISPAYRRSEDLFPVPDRASGVTRYDLVRPWLPPPGQAGGGATGDDVPATRHFRKMAIYVQDGRLIQVLERVEVIGRGAEEFIDFNRAFLREVGLETFIPEFDEAIAAAKAQGDEQELSNFLLQGFNQGLQAAGVDPINIRLMSLDLRDLGDPSIRVDLPGDTIEGSLALLINRGIKPVVTAEEDAPAPAAPSGETAGEDDTPGLGVGEDEGGGEGGGGGDGDPPDSVDDDVGG